MYCKAIYQLCKFTKLHGNQLIKCTFHFLHGSAVQKVKSSDWSIVVLQVPG